MKQAQRRAREQQKLAQQGGAKGGGAKLLIPGVGSKRTHEKKRSGDKREFANSGINLGALTGEQ